MKISCSGRGLDSKVHIVVNREDLPSDGDIEKKWLPVVLTPEELECYVDEHWPESDQAILKIDPEKVEEAMSYVREEMARLPIREGDCDCNDPHCPHKGPISPLALMAISAGAPETKDLNLEAWRPFEYPIVKHMLADRQLLLISASCVTEGRLNAMRCMIDYELKPQEEPIRINCTQYFDVLEGIYFYDEVPSQFEVCSNDRAMPVVPTGRYNFVGFALRSRFCVFTIKIKPTEKRPVKIGFIGWNFNDTRILKELQHGEFLSKFVDKDRTFDYIYRQQGGFWDSAVQNK